MNFRLFTLFICLSVTPIISFAQSLEDPLGQINNSLQHIVKDGIFYLIFVSFVIGLIIYLVTKTFNGKVVFFGFSSLILLIIWLMI